jgi:hypothetical protein
MEAQRGKKVPVLNGNSMQDELAFDQPSIDVHN